MFRSEGDQITITMSREDWELLHLMVGMACSDAAAQPFFWDWIAFINRLNEGNPDFTPYEIPSKQVPHSL